MKTIALLDQHETLKALAGKINVANKTALKIIDESSARTREAVKPYEKEKEQLWHEITEYLHANDLLPWDYSEEKGHNLNFNLEMGTMNCNQSPEKDMAEQLLKHLREALK